MSNKNTRRLCATLLTLGIAPGLLVAEETPIEMIVPEAEPSVNEVEIGFGHVSDDAYHFGRYNGLTDEGPYLNGNVKAKSYDEEGGFWKLRGTNLGLESRYLRLDTGVQGSQQIFIEYDQLPDYENDTGTTPFVNPGSTNLVLPDNYSFSNLDSFLRPFKQKTDRERLGVGGQIQLKSRWQLSGSVSHETKQGTDWIGAAYGPSRPDTLFRFTNGALLPEPIDYETDKIDMALSYQGKETQMTFAYHGSLFDNNDSSLSWTDPLGDPNPLKPPDTYRPGRISLEPDNEMHQLSAVLGHVLSPTSRLTGLASVSRLTQDQDFLPYTINDNVTSASLPQNSLDGEVLLYRGQLKLTSRPLSKLRLSAQYNYDERDNKTSVNSYTYNLADDFAPATPGVKRLMTNPRSNDPLSYRKNTFDLSGNYRINSKMSLRGGYQFKHIHRDDDDEERKTTRERTFSARFKYKPISKLSLAVYGEYGKRNGSSYNTRLFGNLDQLEHEDLRVFYLADLDRDTVGTSINYMPTDRLSFSLTTEYLRNDYPDTEIGLKESRQTSALFDASYQITDDISTHAFYNYEKFTSNNASENREPEKENLDVWDADLRDRVNSFGLGIEVKGLSDKWDAGLDWVYTHSNSKTDMTGFRAPLDEITGLQTAPLAPIDPTEQFSDLKTSLSSVQLWAKYHYSDKIAYKLSYWYERYNTKDWSVEGTINNYYPLENDTISQLLLLGEDRLDYDQHVVWMSVNVKF